MITPSRRLPLALLAASALLAAACGAGAGPTADVGDPPSADDPGGGAAGACLAGASECDDTGGLPVGDEPPGETPVEQPPTSGACAPGHADCEEIVVIEDPDGDGWGDAAPDFDVAEARAAAEALLGTPEGELAQDVRIGRRGDERFALTEDYVLGRMTVELDDPAADDRDGFVVTAVTVELPDGPEVYDLGR